MINFIGPFFYFLCQVSLLSDSVPPVSFLARAALAQYRDRYGNPRSAHRPWDNTHSAPRESYNFPCGRYILPMIGKKEVEWGGVITVDVLLTLNRV